MSLDQEIAAARRKVVTDGYEMSIGEIMSLYKNSEFVINPEFQRLFRWSISQKTSFIESLLLGIPIPPIFVFQTEAGTWELVDGLQRLSTVFEFTGVLRGLENQILPASTLEGTDLLPSLAGQHWEPAHDGDPDVLPSNQQLQIKRARLRVEILKSESDPDAKFELFQRLNTGGSILSEQEVRNCVLVMVNRDFFQWLQERLGEQAFVATFPMSETAYNEQRPIEMVLRFLAFRLVPYTRGLDVNAYLDKAALQLARLTPDQRAAEERVFRETFSLLKDTLGINAFKRWDGRTYSGQALQSAFEVIAIGVAHNLEAILALPEEDRKAFVADRIRAVWQHPTFVNNSGMGVRGTTRLQHLLPLGLQHFRP